MGNVFCLTAKKHKIRKFVVGLVLVNVMDNLGPQ